MASVKAGELNLMEASEALGLSRNDSNQKDGRLISQKIRKATGITRRIHTITKMRVCF
jgi:hypothetical protein